MSRCNAKCAHRRKTFGLGRSSGGLLVPSARRPRLNFTLAWGGSHPKGGAGGGGEVDGWVVLARPVITTKPQTCCLVCWWRAGGSAASAVCTKCFSTFSRYYHLIFDIIFVAAFQSKLIASVGKWTTAAGQSWLALSCPRLPQREKSGCKIKLTYILEK